MNRIKLSIAALIILIAPSHFVGCSKEPPSEAATAPPTAPPSEAAKPPPPPPKTKWDCSDLAVQNGRPRGGCSIAARVKGQRHIETMMKRLDRVKSQEDMDALNQELMGPTRSWLYTRYGVNLTRDQIMGRKGSKTVKATRPMDAEDMTAFLSQAALMSDAGWEPTPGAIEPDPADIADAVAAYLRAHPPTVADSGSRGASGPMPEACPPPEAGDGTSGWLAPIPAPPSSASASNAK